MKNLILSTALLVGSLPVLGASTAMQQASLFHDQAKPLQLDVEFLAQINVPVQGHLTLKRGARDRWWRGIVMGDFEETDIRSGDRLYINRNIRFTPRRIGELISLLQFAEGFDGLLVRKQKRLVENDIEMSCLQVKQENVRSKAHQVCINSASHEIVSDEWRDSPDERRRQQYSD